MSSPSNSASNSSGSESEESYYEDVTGSSDFVPYDENLEPMATEEEAAQYEARKAHKAKVERENQARFAQEVELNTWYFFPFLRFYGLHRLILLFARSMSYE